MAATGDGERSERSEERGGRARLRADLMALGRGLDVPEPDGSTMAERVLAQIVAEAVPVPVREPPGRLERVGAWARRHVRILAAGLSGLLVVLVLTPPVRAAVVDWLDFGGVEVRYVPDAGTAGDAAGTGAPDPRGPGCDAPVSMAEAVRRAGFRPVVPGVLGAPDAVAVTGLPEGRSMVTLCWLDGGQTIRLDEFASGLDPYFIKQVRTQPERLKLNADTSEGSGQVAGLWFAEPHLLRFGMLDADGGRWTRSERTAGPTLLWTRGERLTLRLEGVASRERARAVAESAF